MKRLLAVLGVAAVVAGAVVLEASATGYIVYLVNLLLVTLVLSLGLHVVIGESGQFSLAHSAFYGIGIYATAIATTAHWPFILALGVGGLAAAVCGLVIGLLALRMRDIYLALSTFAFGEAMQWVFLNWEAVTGGPNGYNIPPTKLFGFAIMSDREAFPLVAVLAVLFLAATLVLHHSGFGRALRAVRESEIAAAAVGVNVKLMKLAAFTLSALLAGAAGGMFTTFSTFIHPDSLGFSTTVLVLTVVVVGGIGSVWGVVGGAVVFGLLNELLRQLPSYQEMIYGAILMGFMMFAPRGMFAALRGAR
ncbi:branched-chain amino acid ABC transporter permease [Aliidongia dinghuensis]|uniref:Branched-chain amino acid ABC transporter permease n=1 Tax=Aliidongia dinghuensis TaxID=1867774 RepID=A0A8J2YYX9_9PROT|nr:branched-chain amino acid ABC transporter permease [Aliidongia dinghuensis]GGF42909.1 branched-chain amino acid ABC transporter permease [Aliidongia dinghuensis]